MKSPKLKDKTFSLGGCILTANEIVQVWASDNHYETLPLYHGDGKMFRRFPNRLYNTNKKWLQFFLETIYRQKLATKPDQKEDMENLTKLQEYVKRMIAKIDEKSVAKIPVENTK